jgi:hypothetical protein
MGWAPALPTERVPPIYRPRQPRKTPLFQLLEAHYDDVKALWEERFEKTHGRWRGFVDHAVWRYLDCGIAEAGFARLKCCKCPSCNAKRAAAFAAFLQDELLEDVGHSLWTFTIPKMLRPYFMYQRELLGDLARLAYETMQELMSEAVGDPRARPGVVAVPRHLATRSVHIHTPIVSLLEVFGMTEAIGSPSPTSIQPPPRSSSLTKSFTCSKIKAY